MCGSFGRLILIKSVMLTLEVEEVQLHSPLLNHKA